MNHNWVKDEFLMNGSALMGVLGLHNFLPKESCCSSHNCGGQFTGEVTPPQTPSIIILHSCRPCSSHIPQCCYACHGRWSDERNMGSVCIFAGFQVTYNCFFFPISFFNCKYSTSDYYDAFLGIDFSFWGFYLYFCRFWGIFFGRICVFFS